MGRKSGCRCQGHWRHRLVNYVVTRRNEATVDDKVVGSKYSEVKCRECQRKWRSNARYVKDLEDWEERKYKKMTYKMLLKLIRSGRLEIVFGKGEIWKEKKHGKTWSGVMVQLSTRHDRNREEDRGPPYQWVIITDQNYRIEISVQRLVWMAYHDKVVPKGYDIDHYDRNKNNNCIENLRLLPSVENQADDGFSEREPYESEVAF